MKTYFIADISANHDGDFERAKSLCLLAKTSGADAAKFQHFKAETIVSDHGFKTLGKKSSHQAKWGDSVFQVYKNASIPIDWTPKLKLYCDEIGIDFFTTPYDLDYVDVIDNYVDMYKIGLASGKVAVDVLKGKNTEDMPTVFLTDPTDLNFVVNLDVAKQIGITISDEIKKQATTILGE